MATPSPFPLKTGESEQAMATRPPRSRPRARPTLALLYRRLGEIADMLPTPPAQPTIHMTEEQRAGAMAGIARRYLGHVAGVTDPAVALRCVRTGESYLALLRRELAAARGA